MKKFKIKYITFLLLASFWMVSFSVAEEMIINLKDENEIKQAVALNEVIERLSEKVMSCIETNGSKTEGCICVDECSCKFKDDYISVKRAYQRAIKSYPRWEVR